MSFCVVLFTLVNLCGFITLWVFDAQSLLSVATSFLFNISVPVHCSWPRMFFVDAVVVVVVCLFRAICFYFILSISRVLVSFSAYMCAHLSSLSVALYPSLSLSLHKYIERISMIPTTSTTTANGRKQTVSCAMHVEHNSIYWLYGNSFQLPCELVYVWKYRWRMCLSNCGQTKLEN